MNLAYGKKVEKKLSNATSIKKAYGDMAKMVARRIAEMTAMPNLGALQKLPGPNCHPLTGDRKGQWAVNISGNYRMIFIIDQEPLPLDDAGQVNTIFVTDICIIETTDYH
jgi:plasmid maintenance system killer protein